MRAFSTLFLTLFVVCSGARGDVTPAPLFGDHAVLQRDKPIPVWGRAEPGEKITVTFLEQKIHATASADGRWIVFLDPVATLAIGTELVIAGKNTLTLHDVVVGDVWLCVGGASMEQSVAEVPGENSAPTASANFPLLRQVKIERQSSPLPLENVRTREGWVISSAETAGSFGATGFFFARELYQKIGVPVGLVHCAASEASFAAWLSPAAVADHPEFGAARERWQNTLTEFPGNQARFAAEMTAWLDAEAEAKASGATAHAAFLKKNPRPAAPRDPEIAAAPSALFNGMINPLLPYALRGILWSQEESNPPPLEEYRALFGAMIVRWRAHFAQGPVPFYWVQFPNFRLPGDSRSTRLAFLREVQNQTLSLPNTGQAVAIDLGETELAESSDQILAAHRLALLAKHRVYEITGDDTGPTFESARRESAALRVKFSHASGGLVAHDRPIQSLELAGADKVFRAATGKIERDTLLVSSPEIAAPVAVRYAWRNAPDANLYNGAGLPAVPFRSDDW